ncbi:Tll0287-like domain-containing protein [Pseudomonas sp. HK3]
MRTILMLAIILLSSTVLADDTQDARSTIQGFAKDLKHTLISTMKSNGPVAAINVCNLSAPAIAKQHSQSPWQISRTSLQVRNPNNQPSDWLKQVLLEFEQRKQKGEPVAQIEFSQQREDGWYFIKAIPTGEPCLACHGHNIKPAVQTKLAELYPNDTATGFNLGDIRGAFVVKKETFKH